MNLQPGTFLQEGKYKIESPLGQGGFGITYLGWQTGLDRQVAIKEFFMKEYCNRNIGTSHVTIGTEGSRELVGRFRQKFVKEAQIIANLNHPNVVHIYDVFEENGTAYYVMEYVEGGSLQKHITQYGALLETEALHYIRQIASALEYIHNHHMNHLDVKPDNILRKENAQVILIDFGLSKRYDESGKQTSTTPVGISSGYAPIEQYKKGGVSTFSPVTDIYSLGATLYKMLTGVTPPDATDVISNGTPALPNSISSSTNKAFQAAIQPKREDRPQNIQQFLYLLNKQDKKIKTDEDTIITAKKEYNEKNNKNSENRHEGIGFFFVHEDMLIYLLNNVAYKLPLPKDTYSYDKLTQYIQNVTISNIQTSLKDFLDQNKSAILNSTFLIATYKDTKSNFREILELSNYLKTKLTLNRVRITKESHFVACGSTNPITEDPSKEILYHIEGDREYCQVELGGGVWEICESGLNGTHNNKYDSLVKLSSLQWELNLLKGILLEYEILCDKQKGIVMLDAFPFRILVGYTINGIVRECIQLCDRFNAIPLRKRETIVCNEGDFFIEIEEERFNFPISQYLGYLPEIINIKFEVSTSEMYFIIEDKKEKKNIKIFIHELIR